MNITNKRVDLSYCVKDIAIMTVMNLSKANYRWYMTYFVVLALLNNRAVGFSEKKTFIFFLIKISFDANGTKDNKQSYYAKRAKQQSSSSMIIYLAFCLDSNAFTRLLFAFR